jgi:hypothetical protein
MSSRFISPFYDVGSGIKPSSGAKLFFYADDGVTPKDTYSDQLATPTPNTNPVIADSVGVFGDIYLSGSYKVTLQDKNGSQIFGGAVVEETAYGDFEQNLINDLSQAYEFATVAAMKASTAFPETKIVKTNGYYGGWAAMLEPQGGATYTITTLATVRSQTGDAGWVPDELGDHTRFDGSIAMLNKSGYKVNVLQYGAKNTVADVDSFDSKPSIQAALDYLTSADGVNGIAGECFIPAGNYGILTPLNTPSTIKLYGAGRFDTSIVAMTGFTGDYLLSDKGSAAKLQLMSMRFNAIKATGVLSDVVKLGYTVPYGTEGMIRDILIRGGLNAAAPFSGGGLNVVGNVGYFEAITVEFCGQAFLEGPNSVASCYNTCTTIGSTVNDWSIGTSPRLNNCHIEAPAAACIPINVRNTLSLTGCSVSLGDDDVTEIIRVVSGGLGISVNGLTVLTSNAGTPDHILNDLRAISSADPYWADDATEQGSMYSFSDGGYIRIGTASHITQDANKSLILFSDSTKGAQFTEVGHDNTSIRVSSSFASMYPDPDNTLSAGFASRRFTEIFATNGTINTSDKTEKTDFTTINDALKAAAIDVKNNIQLFRWISAVAKKGDAARWHVGVIAQEVYDIFNNHGINAFDYGFVGIDDLYEDVIDDNGIVVGKEKVGERWNVRPTELIWLILSAMQ